ncbi:MarR family winged helix-turn-helix transcriptional regulator [Hamadaea tsunoensis]|uniref:MarR family winged helix-turn-helix transcriptional regulator n=1 Tax=Hamadaea tsunoensis TaxID=53368 RepID=UPI0004199746|nr:MarR family transcriptional regulator [Hamadaea tsunoensis]
MTDIPIALVLGGGSLLYQIGRELAAATDRRLAAHDLTMQQAALLVYAHLESSPSRLKDDIGTDTAGVTRLLDRLEAKGLLRRERHGTDRRAVVVALTDAGKALVPHLPPLFGEVSTRAFTGFSAAEVEQVRTLLRRMLANLTE